MFLASSLSSRNQLGHLLNNLDLRGEGVEVGTHRAEFAGTMLTNWDGRKLTCVDPWYGSKEDAPDSYKPQIDLLDGGPKNAFMSACAVLREFPNRHHIMNATSKEAVKSFNDGSLDFVYLDGDHREEAVLLDLRLWWPKLRAGGIMAGHDIVMPGEPSGGWGRGIQRALKRFFWDYDLDLDHVPDVSLIVEEGGLPWTFYMFKGEDE